MTHNVLAKKLQLTVTEADAALRELGFTGRVANVSMLRGGLLNSNFRVTGDDGKSVLLRAYPPSRPVPEIAFEVEVLQRLAGGFCRTPTCLLDGQIGFVGGRPFVVLEYLKGRTLVAEDLSVELAGEAGQVLASFHSSLKDFKPHSNKARCDTEYIGALIEETSAGLDEREDALLMNLADRVWSACGGSNEWGPPTGVVHADFYVENLIRLESGELALVDFDDSYYGTQFFDVAIAAMEFAMDDSQELVQERLDAFLLGYGLSGEKIREHGGMLTQGMMVNCLRFLCHTLPLTQQDGLPLESNAYYVRARNLLDALT